MRKLLGLILGYSAIAGWGDHRTALATEAAFIQVAQPLHEPNEGTKPFWVTYLMYVGSPIPGLEIRQTGAESPVAIHHGATCGPTSGVRNYSIAKLLDLRIAVEDLADDRTWNRRSGSDRRRSASGYFVDTCDVELDLSHAKAIDLGFVEGLSRDQRVDRVPSSRRGP